MFETGNLITTNGMNGLRIIDSNESDIVVKCLLTDDFSILSKTEHKYELFDPRTILRNELKAILKDMNIAESEKSHLLHEMHLRIDKFIL